MLTLISSVARRWKPRMVVVGQGEHLGDDVEREGEREVTHEVGVAVALELVDERADHRPDEIPLLLDHGVAAEGLLDERPVVWCSGSSISRMEWPKT